MKDPQKVAERLFALIAISAAAHEQPPTNIRNWIEEQSLEHIFSIEENDLLNSDSPDDDQIVRASWRLEGVPVFLWALALLNELPPASTATDRSTIGVNSEFMSDAGKVIASASLRAEDDLVVMRDKIHLLHWGVRAGPSGRRLFPNKGYDESAISGVVYERHYAINWLLDDEEWDFVRTDT